MTIKIDNLEREQYEFNIKPLDPIKNSYKLKFDDLGEVNEDLNPFVDIDDVAFYAKKLRESSWRFSLIYGEKGDFSYNITSNSTLNL